MVQKTLRTIAALALAGGAVSVGGAVSPALAKDEIVVCTIDDLSGDFSIMATPKTYGYQLAVKEINDAGGIEVDGETKMVKLITYDGQSDVGRYQQLAQRCISTTRPTWSWPAIPAPSARRPARR